MKANLKKYLVPLLLALAIPIWEGIKPLIIEPVLEKIRTATTETFKEQVDAFRSASGIEDHKFDNGRFYFLYFTPNVPEGAYYYVSLEVNGIPYLDDEGKIWRMPKEGLWDTSNLTREKFKTEKWWGGFGFSEEQMSYGDEIAVKWHMYNMRTSNEEHLVVMYYRLEEKL